MLKPRKYIVSECSWDFCIIIHIYVLGIARHFVVLTNTTELGI